MRLCIVPCGKRKIWDDFPEAGATEARRTYTGNFAKTCISYAEKFYPNSYIILSAKYGFLFPDEIIPGPYNVTFKDPSTNPIEVEELKIQAEKKGLMKYDEIVVLGGRNYVSMAREVFQEKKIVDPLRGLSGMGEMIGALKRAIIEGRELQEVERSRISSERIEQKGVRDASNFTIWQLRAGGPKKKSSTSDNVSLTAYSGKKKSGAPTVKDFQRELDRIFDEAMKQGRSFVDVVARDLHNPVGGYSGSNHRMPSCCDVMRKNMKAGDEILSGPPSGAGANLTIRYRLPR